MLCYGSLYHFFMGNIRQSIPVTVTTPVKALGSWLCAKKRPPLGIKPEALEISYNKRSTGVGKRLCVWRWKVDLFFHHHSRVYCVLFSQWRSTINKIGLFTMCNLINFI